MNNCEFFYEEKQLSLLRIDNYVAGVKNVPVWQLWLAPEVWQLRVKPKPMSTSDIVFNYETYGKLCKKTRDFLVVQRNNIWNNLFYNNMCKHKLNLIFFLTKRGSHLTCIYIIII